MSTGKLLNTFDDIKTFMDSLVAGNYLLKGETNYHAGQGRNKFLTTAELSKLVALPIITQTQVDNFIAAYDRGDWNTAIVDNLETDDPAKIASASTVFDLKQLLDSIEAELAANVAKTDVDNNFTASQTVDGDITSTGVVTAEGSYGFSIGDVADKARVVYGGGRYVFFSDDNNYATVQASELNLTQLAGTDSPGSPTLRFGNNGTGFHESADDVLHLSTGSVSRLSVSTTDFISDLPITASSFATPAGTASQFLKADGSIDENVYALAADSSAYAKLDGSNMPFTGNLEVDGEAFFNGNLVAQGTLTAEGSYGFSIGDAPGKARIGYGGGRYIFLQEDSSKAVVDASSLMVSQVAGIDTPLNPTIRFGNGGTGFYESADDVLHLSTGSVSRLSVSTTDFISDLPITATSFTKQGGTASQFLKADGSVDENVYALDSDFSAYAKLDGSNMPFTADVESPNFKLADWNGWFGFHPTLAYLQFGTTHSTMRLHGSYTINMNSNGYGARNFFIQNNGVNLYHIEADLLKHTFSGDVVIGNETELQDRLWLGKGNTDNASIYFQPQTVGGTSALFFQNHDETLKFYLGRTADTDGLNVYNYATGTYQQRWLLDGTTEFESEAKFKSGYTKFYATIPGKENSRTTINNLSDRGQIYFYDETAADFGGIEIGGTSSSDTGLVVDKNGSTFVNGHLSIEDTFAAYLSLIDGNGTTFQLNSGGAGGGIFSLRNSSTDTDLIQVNTTGNTIITGTSLIVGTNEANGGIATIGNTKVGSWELSGNDFAFFGHADLDHTDGTKYSVIQGVSGDTFINAPAGEAIYFRNGNTDKLEINEFYVDTKTVLRVNNQTWNLNGSFWGPVNDFGLISWDNSNDEFTVHARPGKSLALGADGVDKVYLRPTGELEIIGQGTPANPALSIGNGGTGIYEVSDGVLGFTANGSSRFYINSAGFNSSVGANGAFISRLTASSVLPVFSFVGDTDTGMGKWADNKLSLIGGGNEIARLNGSNSSDLSMDVFGALRIGATTATAITDDGSNVFWDGNIGITYIRNNADGQGIRLQNQEAANKVTRLETVTGGGRLYGDWQVDGNQIIHAGNIGTYTSAEEDTLDSVTGRNNTTTNTIVTGGATINGDLTVTSQIFAGDTNGDHTELQASGLYFERSASYLRPKTNNAHQLYIGAFDGTATWNAVNIHANAFNYNGQTVATLDQLPTDFVSKSAGGTFDGPITFEDTIGFGGMVGYPKNILAGLNPINGLLIGVAMGEGLTLDTETNGEGELSIDATVARKDIDNLFSVSQTINDNLTIDDLAANSNLGDQQSFLTFKGRYWGGDNDLSYSQARIRLVKDNTDGNAGSKLSFDVMNSAGGASILTERMSIDSSGTVLINENLNVGGNITASNLNIGNWNTAYGWGDHAGQYESIFSKNSAFNKNFGTATNTVAEGDDSRINNGQTAYDRSIAGSGVGFNTSSGVLTLSQQDGGTISEDLDGRYALQSYVDSFFYFKSEINDYFSGVTSITGYNKSNWDSAYSFSSAFSISDYYSSLDSRYLTSFSETDTFQSVTDRGNTTTNGLVINSGENTPINVTASANLLADFTSTDGIGEIRIGDNNGYTRLLNVGSSFKIMPNNGSEVALFEGDTLKTYLKGDLEIAGNATISDLSGSGLRMVTINDSGILGAQEITDHSGLYVSTTGGTFTDDIFIDDGSTSINLSVGSSYSQLKMYSANGGSVWNRILDSGSTSYVAKYARNNADTAFAEYEEQWYTGNGFIKLSATSGGTFDIGATVLTKLGLTIWDAGNDGSGSGLDADTVDGLHASYFATHDHHHDGTYLTSYTETDTLDSVTARGSVSNRAISILAGATNNSLSLSSQTTNGTYILFDDLNTTESLQFGGFINRFRWIKDGVVLGDMASSFELNIDITAPNLNVSNWDTAYGWGDHALQGYLTTESDTLQSVTDRGEVTTNQITVGSTATNETLRVTSNNPYISFYTTGNLRQGYIQKNHNSDFAMVAESGDLSLAANSGDVKFTGTNVTIGGSNVATQAWVNSNAGTVTNVTVGTGLDVATGTTTPHISLDFSEITQAGTLQGTDDFVVLDGSSTRLKQASGIDISIFNNDTGFITSADLSGYANLNGSSSESFSVSKLRLQNNESTDATSAGDLIYDTNDISAPASLGSFTTNPIGLYVHDGVDVRRIWTTDNFGGTQVANWVTAYGWGDHALQGYLTTESDTLQSVTDRGAGTSNKITVNLTSQNETLRSISDNPFVSFYTTDNLRQGYIQKVHNGHFAMVAEVGDLSLTATTGDVKLTGTNVTIGGSTVATQAWVNAQNFGVGSGDITSVTAGTNLNGGGTSGAVTLNLDSALTSISSITLDGILIDESNHRAGLIEVHRDGGSGYAGYAIDFDGQHWTLMGNETRLGLYDDSLSHWFVYCTANEGVSLRYQGVQKLKTTLTGGTLDGIWNATTDLTVAGNPVATEAWVIVQGFNSVIGTDSDINTSGATIIDSLTMTDGVITSHGTRILTLANLGYTGAANANYITNNNQLTNGAGYLGNQSSIASAALDSTTGNGLRQVTYSGYSKHLLSWNSGGSTGTVQQEFDYNTPVRGWRIRNKTDNSTWSAWGYVAMTTTNQGHISGNLLHTNNVASTVDKAYIDALNVDADTLDSLSSGSFIRSNAADTVSAHTTWEDTKEVRLGSGSDLRLSHTSGHSFIGNYTGNLYIRNYTHGGDIYIQGEDAGGTNEPMIYCYGGGEVNLYWDGDKKLSTASNGVNVTGHLIASSNVYAAGNTFVFGTSTSEGEYFSRSGNDINVVAGGSTRLTIGTTLTSTVSITAPNFIDSSDSRLKEELNIPLPGLSLINKLEPKIYLKNAIVESGFYADQLPEEAEYMRHKIDGDYWGMDYKNLHAVEVNAIKELSQKVTVLEEEKSDLENRIALLESKLEMLMERLG